jgi:hypothetical protein
MSKYALIREGVVTKISCNPSSGLIKVPESVVVGMTQKVLGSDIVYVDENSSYKSEQVKAKREYDWAYNELLVADVEINKHLDSSAAASFSEQGWRSYRNALREYCSSSINDNGDIEYKVNDISNNHLTDEAGRPSPPTN